MALLQVPGHHSDNDDTLTADVSEESEFDESHIVTVIIDNGTHSLKYGYFDPEQQTFPSERLTYFVKKDFGDMLPNRYYRGKCFPFYKSQLLNTLNNWEHLLLLYKEILNDISLLYHTSHPQVEPKHMLFNLVLTEHPATSLIQEFKKSKALKLEKLFEFDERVNAIHIANTALLSVYAALAKPDHSFLSLPNSSKPMSPVSDVSDEKSDTVSTKNSKNKNKNKNKSQNDANKSNNSKNESNSSKTSNKRASGAGGANGAREAREELTGLVVDIGHHTSYVCPVEQGNTLSTFCFNFDVSGEDITLNINHFINKSLELREIKSQYNDTSANDAARARSGSSSETDEFSIHEDTTSTTSKMSPKSQKTSQTSQTTQTTQTTQTRPATTSNASETVDSVNSANSSALVSTRDRGGSSAMTATHFSRHRDSSYIYNYNEFDRLSKIDRIKCHTGNKEYPRPFCSLRSIMHSHRRSSSLLNFNSFGSLNLPLPSSGLSGATSASAGNSGTSSPSGPPPAKGGARNRGRRRSRTSRASWTNLDSKHVVALLQSKQESGPLSRQKSTGDIGDKSSQNYKKKDASRMSVLDPSSLSKLGSLVRITDLDAGGGSGGSANNPSVITLELPIGAREDADHITIKLTNSQDKFEDACEILFDPSKAMLRKTRDKLVYKKNPVSYPNYVKNKGIHLIVLKCVLDTCDIGIEMDLNDLKANYTIETEIKADEKSNESESLDLVKERIRFRFKSSAKRSDGTNKWAETVSKNMINYNKEGLKEMERFFGNIILSGGTCGIDGFDGRLKEELELLINGKFGQKVKQMYPGYKLSDKVNVRIYGMKEYEHRRKFHSFYGACHYIEAKGAHVEDVDDGGEVMSPRSATYRRAVEQADFWITREDYDQWDEQELEKKVKQRFW